jgi:hypothetical protein
MGHWDEPPSLSGLIHGGAAMVAFLAFPIAALLLSGRLGRFSGSSLMHGVLTGTAAASLTTLLIFFGCLAPVFSNRPPFLLGLVERVLIVFLYGLDWKRRVHDPQEDLATRPARKGAPPNLGA